MKKTVLLIVPLFFFVSYDITKFSGIDSPSAGEFIR